MEKYTRRPNCQCATCGKYIYRRPGQIAKGPVYCSNNCYGKACSILVPCEVCGKEMLSGLNKKTCSRACANKLRIGTTYKSGRPSKDKVKSHDQLKIRLISLRGSSCERCNHSNTKILEVHHVIRQCDGGTDDIDNLQLICPNCHAEEHYGNKL